VKLKIVTQSDWRCYIPRLRWYWWDEFAGCLSLSFGNANCDPLLCIDLEVTELPKWLVAWFPP